MDNRFQFHNTHLEDAKHFAENDPQLRRLQQQKYIYHSPILEQLPTHIPGIYTLGGGRQIGKTTLLKQWMETLLLKGIAPTAIAFFTGELIDDHHTLLHLLQAQLAVMPANSLNYLLIDEVTYIHEWDRAIKYAADAGLLEQTILVLTGSDLVLIQEARMRFPGRRGKATHVNFHLYPLSFREYIFLVNKNLAATLSTDAPEKANIVSLYTEFQNYLVHGGYLTAINEQAMQGTILPATLATYADWVRGDVIKHGKQEHYLREIIQAIIKRYNSQITWNNLAKDLSIDHPKTVADYIALLESLDVVFIQHALLEDKLTAAPKKARKVMFTDPFIFHSLCAWLWPTKNPYESQIIADSQNPELQANLVEACVVSLYRRFYPTYYIKAEGEVDIAYVNENRFWPIEIKWTNHLHTKNLKQIIKYKNARIFTKSMENNIIHGIKTESLPLALFKLDETVVLP